MIEADVTWRHDHDTVRRVSGEELWIVRDFLDGGAVVTVRDRAGDAFGTLRTNGTLWYGVLPSGTTIPGNVSQSRAALDLRTLVWQTLAEQRAEDDPALALAEWDAARPRSQKSSDAHVTGHYGVGPSDLGQCEKAIEFRERPPEGHEPIDVPKDAAIAGQLFHDAMTEARRFLYPWRRYKVPIDIPGLDRPGEADEFDPYIGRVTDYKSAGSYKWDLIGKDGPPENEWKQALTYGYGLVAAGYEVNTVELLYYNREKGLQERFVRPYSEALAKAALAQLHVIMDALEEGAPLPRRREGDELLGPTVNTLCARYCPHVKTCWNLDEVPPNRTPEGYLLVQPDDDGVIADTLHVYDDSRTVETDSKKQKTYAKTLVEGLTPGTYGDMTLRWTGGNKSLKPDPEAREQQLAEAMRFARETGEIPPDPDELPYPEKDVTRSKSIEIKRVRAAQRETK